MFLVFDPVRAPMHSLLCDTFLQNERVTAQNAKWDTGQHQGPQYVHSLGKEWGEITNSETFCAFVKKENSSGKKIISIVVIRDPANVNPFCQRILILYRFFFPLEKAE